MWLNTLLQGYTLDPMIGFLFVPVQKYRERHSSFRPLQIVVMVKRSMKKRQRTRLSKWSCLEEREQGLGAEDDDDGRCDPMTAESKSTGLNSGHCVVGQVAFEN